MTHNLHNPWIFWFHDPLDRNWKINSYKNIKQINTIEDFWMLYTNLNNKIVENSMLFLMKKDIDPLWEHKENINGGCFSLKIQKGNIYDYWTNISIALINNELMDTDDIIVNGISISPKKNFCIIKIWINKNNGDIKNLKKNKNLNYKGIIFKAHSF